jgi:hypothetical protein
MGVNVALDFKIHVLADGEIVPDSFKVKSAVPGFPISWKQDSRTLPCLVREETEWYCEWRRDFGYHHISRTRDHFFPRNDLTSAEFEPKIRMIFMVAGCIGSILDIGDVILHFLDNLAMKIPFILLGYDSLDVPLFCLEVISHGF